jgi:shikimate dehydrogenase
VPPAAASFTPDGQTRLYGVLGHPVAASLSPAFQNAGFRALGLNALYVAFPVLPDDLAVAVRGLAAAGIAGFNLTAPHKVAILPLLERILPEAQAIGAVNTVRCEPAGSGTRLIGTNTDGSGFLRSLERDLNLHPRGKRILMLGAGGAARGIAHALLREQAATLWIANRTLSRAVELVAALRAHYPAAQIEALPLESAPGLAPHLLVNTTTVGMGDGKSPLRLSAVRVQEAVVDIVYHHAETPLLAEARALGLPHTSGIGMLLYQGAAGFEFWTGKTAPVEPMRAALLTALRARG